MSRWIIELEARGQWAGAAARATREGRPYCLL